MGESMVKVERHEYMTRVSIICFLCVAIFLSILGYFLGWEFQWISFAILLGAIIGQGITAFVLYFLLRILMKNSYYIATNSEITRHRKGKKIYIIQKGQIKKLSHIGMWRPQVGSGSLMIAYTRQSADPDEGIVNASI